MTLPDAEVHSFNTRTITYSLSFDKDVLHDTSIHQLLYILIRCAISCHRLTPLPLKSLDGSQSSGNLEGANILLTGDVADTP